MKRVGIVLFAGFLTPFVANAANEGVPSYYQNMPSANANQVSYGTYANQGYTKYIGQSGNKQIIDSRSYTYQVPRQTQNTNITNGMMTTNGITGLEQANTSIYAGYGRRFADFEFETGVNSILEWDDMVFNEIRVGGRHNFSVRNFDMFAYADYAYGRLDHGGLSMDYDLKPFDMSVPNDGIFTISIGDQSGRTNHFRFGLGARNIWDIGGWKLSPVVGYEIFKHNLEMSNHIYPNPAIYLPLMTSNGEYVFANQNGEYFAINQAYVDQYLSDDLYQVCMSPEDIKVVPSSGGGAIYYLGDSLTTQDYNESMGDLPWGVGSNECVIIGGDGMILVDGTTHIYNTTWSGFYLGLEIEKQMTISDKLRFYMQIGMPKYSSEGIWPNRDDWQQNPSFIDEGTNGSYSYAAELEYDLKLSDRLQLSIKADTNYFHIGKIGGKLYVAEYSYWATDEYGDLILDDNGYPYIETVPAYTQDVTDSLNRAAWQSFSVQIGVKYAF